MSQENVEIVRRFLAILSASPDEIRAAVRELWDADADFYPAPKFPGAHPCHGVEEIAEFIARFRDVWACVEWAAQDLIEVGEAQVLTCSRMRAEGRESGMKIEGDLYQCWWLRHGRFFRVEDHLTLAGALRALGLQGETLEAVGLSE